jgi:seryl-tRNA synthetase
MLDIRWFREEPDRIRDALRRRGEDIAIVDRIRDADERRRSILTEVEALRAQRNEASKAIGRTRDPAERESKIAAMRQVNASIDSLEAQLASAEVELNALVLQVPNIPRADVPVGSDESGNVVVRHWGEPAAFDFEPKAHWDLGPSLGLIDFDRGVRLSGSRFYILTAAGARLQRALIQFMLDSHSDHGYTEIYPPFIVREQCMWNAGQLPKFGDNLYHDSEEDLWLIPTAEVPLTNLHAEEILSGDTLPRHYVSYTACFRREKMKAGRDVRGIKRGHQFDKVELYHFTTPETSGDSLDHMVSNAEFLLRTLAIPYRVVQLCTGDLGFGSTVTYDLEAWAPGCGEWLEVSSLSDFGSFQARRAGIRFRREAGAATEFVHTLNGSGLALPRTLIAVMENYQQADGSILVPEVLRARMGMDRITAESGHRL